MAQLLRKRLSAAGVSGVHVLAYVDDYLICGDTEELARVGARYLEGLFAEFGLIWAPQKRRGPAQVIEFLGLLINNSPLGPRGIGLSLSRQRLLREMIDQWKARAPPRSERRPIVETNPRDLAKLLGLVFASQVVPGGRVYMQCMLSSFRASSSTGGVARSRRELVGGER